MAGHVLNHCTIGEEALELLGIAKVANVIYLEPEEAGKRDTTARSSHASRRRKNALPTKPCEQLNESGRKARLTRASS